MVAMANGPKYRDSGPAPDRETVLGTGVLNWSKGERQTDRYGTVKLFVSPDQRDDNLVNLLRNVEGQSGRLIAYVRESRDSYHVGDLHRGIGPVRPRVGERIVLGEGTLFFEPSDVGAVGLRPSDGRDTDWLDPRALYRAHHQTVDLIFQKFSGT